MEFSRQINGATVEHYLPAFEALDELAVKISGTEFSSASFGEVENEIQLLGQEVLRQMAQGYLNQRSQSEKKKEFVIGDDGYNRRYRRVGCNRKLESRFGEVKVSRIGYRGPELNLVFPLDAGTCHQISTHMAYRLRSHIWWRLNLLMRHWNH